MKKKYNFLDAIYHDVRVLKVETYFVKEGECESQRLKILLELTEEDIDSFPELLVWCYFEDLVSFSFLQSFYYLGVPMISSVERLSVKDVWVKEQVKINKVMINLSSCYAYRVYTERSTLNFLLNSDIVFLERTNFDL